MSVESKDISNNLPEEIKEFNESFNMNSEVSITEADELSNWSDKTNHKNRTWKYCFCRAHNQNKIRWDLFIMLLAVINWFQVPYNVAFASNDNNNIALDVFNTIIDFMFIMDIIISFRSSYIIEATGDEVMDCKTIAISYLKGRFWIDLLACLPFDLLSYIFQDINKNNEMLNIFGLLKLIRVLRLSKLITYLNLKSELKMSIKLGKLIFFLLLYLHCLGWVWYYIIKQNDEWIPPLDYLWVGTDMYTRSDFYKYWISLYHSVLMLGGGDVGPRGEFQLLFVAIILIMGAIINANIFGNMAVLYSALNRKAATFQEKMEDANETMKNLKVPDTIQEEVKSYLSYTQSNLDHQNEFNKFLEMLSPSLRIQISKHINYDALISNKLLSGNEEVIQVILSDLTTHLYLPEDEIIRQGDITADTMYFIAKGSWEVFVIDENSISRSVTLLEKGNYFGEVALLKDCRRTASVISKNYSTWAGVKKASLSELLTKFPNIKDMFSSYITKSYNDKWHKFMKRCLRNIDYLSSRVSDLVLDEICYRLEPIHCNKETVLFKAGTPWKDIHIITSGEVKIFVNNNNRDTYLDTLYTGCIIGSYCSLTSDYYSMTAIWDTDWKILKLQYSDLVKIRQEHDDLDQQMIFYENYCDDNGLPYCDYKLHRNRSLNMNPIQKFRLGIKRIMRIVKSYKSTALTEFLQKVVEKVKEDKITNENKRKNRLRRRSQQLTPEERTEQSLIALTEKVERLNDTIEKQNDMILNLQKELLEKMENLNLVRLADTPWSDTDSNFSNEGK